MPPLAPVQHEPWASPMYPIRIAVTMLVLITCAASSAQDELLISCDDAPPQAVVQLPEPLATWGKLYCTKYGHTVGSRDRWIWSFPGALSPVHLPAQMGRGAPKELRHAAYFQKIEFVALTGRAAKDAADRINGKFATGSDSPVSSAFRLTLTNQDGKSHVVLFAITVSDAESGMGHWGFWCQSECQDGTPFMLLNYEAQRK